MATLTVLKFPTADGADTMLGTLQALQKQQLITIQDAAIVTWPAGKKKPKTRQLQSLAGSWRADGRVLGYAVRAAVLHPDSWAWRSARAWAR